MEFSDCSLKSEIKEIVMIEERAMIENVPLRSILA